MSRTTLLARVFDSPSFQASFRRVVIESVRQDFPGIHLDDQQELRAKAEWPYLLACASLFAQSELPEHQDAALRIAQASIQLPEQQTEDVRVAAAAVLDALTNNPGLALSIRRALVPADYAESLPQPLQLDLLRRRFETTVQTRQGVVRFTRFQAEVYHGAKADNWLSISAPTSAGKSFVLNQIVGSYLDGPTAVRIAYVVPTRALIQQVISDLVELNTRCNRQNVFVTAMPHLPEDRQSGSCVFVVTQERMHWLLSELPSGFSLDLLVVDEAQKISDGSRGILLQQVVETAARAFPGMRVLFSSPLTTNPELLVEDVPQGRSTHFVRSGQPTVNQNLVWLNQVPGDVRRWRAELANGEAFDRLGEVRLPEAPNPLSKRLPFVAYAATASAALGGCLIYVDTQSKAEKAAYQLAQLRKAEERADDELTELINLVRKIVHPKYLLVETLAKGVGFHYGNMPLLIRTEIERLFKKGTIQFLVCTATLIEGVNLPAKYIFVRGPQKGSKPLTPADFWNLAGRAGRLGTEFQGTIICVDPTVKSAWKEPPPTQRSTYPIKRALDDVLRTREQFVAFLDLERTDRQPQRKPEFEHALAYCTQILLRGESLTEHAWANRFSRDALETIEAGVKAAIEGITVNRSIIERNAGVSPIAQQRLLNFFRNYAESVEQLVPYAPEDPTAVQDSYLRLIGNMSKYLSGDVQALVYPRAILVVNWMRGYSLRRMIEENIKYWSPRRDIPQIIRRTMEDVEQYARFSFVKFVSCYIDVLKQHLAEVGRVDLLEKIPALQIYAEFGASQKTQMSLMDIGLSRVAAIELSEFITETDLDRNACMAWLQKDLTALGLSPIVLREVKIFQQEIDRSALSREITE